MLNYLLKRILSSIPILFIVTILSFTILHIAPGDPTEMMMSPSTRPEDRARIKRNLGLDRPLPIQYLIWLKNLTLKRDLGYSLVNGQPVWKSITERIPATLLLMLTAYLISLSLSIPLGIVTAIRQYSSLDYLLSIFAFIGLSLPSFWLALMAIYFFSWKLGFLPSMGMASFGVEGISSKFFDLLIHLILPASVLAVRNLANWTRYIRSSMLEVIREDYIRTAYAKGLPGYIVIYKHALKNAVLPLITLLGLSLPELLSGSFIIEFLFAWPGMGRLGMEAVFHRDYTILMGDIFLSSCLVITGNIIADVSYAWADPRIRLEKE